LPRCHTGPDTKPFAGGVELKTPFGTFVSPNITPDKDAGIGAWTDDEFVSALWQAAAITASGCSSHALSVVHANCEGRRTGDPRLSEDNRAGRSEG